MWGELSSEWGELSSECGASRLGASCLWGELSVIPILDIYCETFHIQIKFSKTA